MGRACDDAIGVFAGSLVGCQNTMTTHRSGRGFPPRQVQTPSSQRRLLRIAT
jgi:hypothetical protein